MVVIATPERSGTRRLAFDICGSNKRGMVPILEHRHGSHELLYCALYNHEMDALRECAKTMLVLTTNRPEADVRASWHRNSMDLSVLDEVLANWWRVKTEMNPYVVQLGYNDGAYS